MAAIMTERGHVNRALGFLDTKSIFIGIGRQTQWADEQNPPEPTGNESSVQEVVGYKRIFNKRLVVQDDGGNIRYKGQNWREVAREDAFTQGAKWVMLEAFLEYDELPVDISYRQIGVFTGLVPKTGFNSVDALLPDNVQDPGVLEIVDNRKLENRDKDKKEGIILIVQF